MPQVKRTVTLAAVGDTVNIMEGSPYRVNQFPTFVEIALLAAAGDAPTATITTGSDVLLLNGVLDPKVVTLPITKEDFQFQDTVLPTEEIIINVTATAAGDIVRALVNITPL